MQIMILSLAFFILLPIASARMCDGIIGLAPYHHPRITKAPEPPPSSPIGWRDG